MSGRSSTFPWAIPVIASSRGSPRRLRANQATYCDSSAVAANAAGGGSWWPGSRCSIVSIRATVRGVSVSGTPRIAETVVNGSGLVSSRAMSAWPVSMNASISTVTVARTIGSSATMRLAANGSRTTLRRTS